MFKFCTFLLCVQVTLANVAIACVWSPTSIRRYWPSTSIKVCFVEQTMEASSSRGINYSADLRPSRRLMTEAIQEISDKTRFNFSGFTQCDPSDTSPMIRIKIDRTMRGEALSIGPESAQQSHNLEMSQLPNETLVTQMNQVTGVMETIDYNVLFKATTQHELLHLLGFHHDFERGSKAWNSAFPLFREDPLYDPLYDSASIMAASNQLSERDIQCINRLAISTTRNARVQVEGSRSSTPAPGTSPTSSESIH